MSQVINITHEWIRQKVEKIIKDRRFPYHSALQISHLREKLIVRLLNHFSARYVLSSDARPMSTGTFPGSAAVDTEEQVDLFISNSILQILQEEDVLKYFPAMPLSSAEEPSHWFG